MESRARAVRLPAASASPDLADVLAACGSESDRTAQPAGAPATAAPSAAAKSADCAIPPPGPLRAPMSACILREHAPGNTLLVQLDLRLVRGHRVRAVCGLARTADRRRRGQDPRRHPGSRRAVRQGATDGRREDRPDLW